VGLGVILAVGTEYVDEGTIAVVVGVAEELGRGLGCAAAVAVETAAGSVETARGVADPGVEAAGPRCAEARATLPSTSNSETNA
jgi:hypothetical protein